MYQDPKLRLKVFGGIGQRLGHISPRNLPSNGDEIVSTIRPTSQKPDIMKSINSGSQLNLDCQDLKRDKRVGVGIGDHADTDHLSSVLDNIVKEARLKHLTAFQSVTQQPTIKEPLVIKPVRHQRNKKLLPGVPVKRSTGHTNITEKDSPDAGGVGLVKDTPTTIPFNETNIATVRCGISNHVAPPLNSIMKKSTLTHTAKCLSITKDRVVKPSSNQFCTDSPQNVEERREICSNSNLQRLNLAHQDLPALPGIGSENPKVATKRGQLNSGPKSIGTDEFLKKLPPVVIRDGKLVDIRGGISSIIQTPKQPGPTVHTIKFDDNHPKIQLKIRSIDGEKIYLVNISPQRTIEDLRVVLDEMTRISGVEPKKYTILNPSNPSKVNGLSNNQLTLQQLGIAHNTVLYLQNSMPLRDVPTQKVDNATKK